MMMYFPSRGAATAAALLLASSLAGGAQAAGAKVMDGATLFKQNCSACHQPQGQGVQGAFPALAGNKFVQGEPTKVAYVLLNGRGGMPTFREDLSNEQIAAVLTFVRSSWGNHAGPVTVGIVARAQGGAGRPQDAPSVLPSH
jgi:mono/diheme cytochrome c family protein